MVDLPANQRSASGAQINVKKKNLKRNLASFFDEMSFDDVFADSNMGMDMLPDMMDGWTPVDTSLLPQTSVGTNAEITMTSAQFGQDNRVASAADAAMEALHDDSHRGFDQFEDDQTRLSDVQEPRDGDAFLDDPGQPQRGIGQANQEYAPAPGRRFEIKGSAGKSKAATPDSCCRQGGSLGQNPPSTSCCRCAHGPVAVAAGCSKDEHVTEIILGRIAVLTLTWGTSSSGGLSGLATPGGDGDMDLRTAGAERAIAAAEAKAEAAAAKAAKEAASSMLQMAMVPRR